jgi:hypothetical protein
MNLDGPGQPDHAHHVDAVSFRAWLQLSYAAQNTSTTAPKSPSIVLIMKPMAWLRHASCSQSHLL